jgi:hypothetical protein
VIILAHSEEINSSYRSRRKNMKKNMGIIDRSIRTVLAIVIAVLIITGVLSGAAAIILGIVAAAFLLTSLVSWCPLYLPFKLSTRKKDT